MSRKICVVTGSRADYGLLRWVMEGIRAKSSLELQIIATGMHLSAKFGSTAGEIEKDGFTIDRKVDMQLDADNGVGLSRSTGLAVSGFGEAFAELRPDLVIVLGDRFEILAATMAATFARIPIAHLHGGEGSEGAFDEAFRHSITKMSHLHFVAAEEYRRRVIQLGEQPDRVFLVGGLGIDNIRKLPLLDRAALEKTLDFRFGKRNLLVTFHPATLENTTPSEQMTELLAALDEFPDTHVIFTRPNGDGDSAALFALIDEYVAAHPNSRAYTSLGEVLYLSCLAHVDGVVGNSSSGLTEVPTFRKGTINVGDRQRGRLMASSVIDCRPERTSIAAAIERLGSPEFRTALETVANPYGDGGASERVVDIVEQFPLENILKKAFHNLNCEER